VINFIVRRLFAMVITLFFISIISFILIELPPGSALDAEIQRLQAVGGNVNQSQRDALKVKYGVDDPITEKYWKWISNAVQGDFGESFQYNRPVRDLIWGRLGFSILLAGSSIIFAWLVAIPIGVYSATHRYTIPDYVITILQFIGVAIPEFLLALVLMVTFDSVGGLFSRDMETAPWSFAKFVDLLEHLWLPVLVVSAGSTAWLTRVMRANLLDVLNQQYVQTARAKGLKESKVIWKHAVRNALHPLIMTIGGVLPALIGGDVVASIVLNLPTAGPVFINALRNQDMYLAITFLMFFSLLLVIGNLIADLLLAWVDPRIRLE